MMNSCCEGGKIGPCQSENGRTMMTAEIQVGQVRVQNRRVFGSGQAQIAKRTFLNMRKTGRPLRGRGGTT